MTKNKLKDSLKKLKGIVEWFDEQEEVDVEAGLEKVKEGAVLIKESRKQLKELENEFEKVKEDLGEEIEDDAIDEDEPNYEDMPSRKS